MGGTERTARFRAGPRPAGTGRPQPGAYRGAIASETPEELDPEDAERRLRAELASIDEAIAKRTAPPPPGSTLQFGKRIGEGTSEAISRFADVGVANDLQAMKLDLEHALEKLEQGSYGICDGCGEAIPAGRLRAAPASALCMECARARG